MGSPNSSRARSPRKPSASQLTPAAAYYRMSSDAQDESIGQQRRAIRDWADRNGRQIVEEFQDDGISGDDTENRKGFQRLIEAAKSARFVEVLVWDQERLGRFHSLEAGRWLGPLVDNQVRVTLVSTGTTIDLGEDMGRLFFAFNTESGHGYLKKLANSQLRARRELAQQGRPIGGPTPFGYFRQVTDDLGNVHTIPRDKEFKKPSGWLVKFVPNEVEAKVVRFIFEQYAELRVLPSVIARTLNQQGIPAPGKWYRKAGEKDFGRADWRHETVREILGKAIYCGDAVAGRRQNGKYTRLIDGQLVPVKGKPKRGERATGHIVVRDAHPAIVTREQWDRAQEIAAAARKSRKAGERGKCISHQYCLTGVLLCGKCGAPMYGSTKHSRDGRPLHVSYACDNSHRKPGGKCGHWSIREDVLLPILLESLEGILDKADLLGHDIFNRRAERISVEAEPLKAELTELRERIEEGYQRALSAPPEHFSGLLKVVKELESRAESLEDRIAAAGPVKEESVLDDWDWLRYVWIPQMADRLVRVWPLSGPECGRKTVVDGVEEFWPFGPNGLSQLAMEAAEKARAAGGRAYISYPKGMPVYSDTRQVQNILREAGMRCRLHFRGESQGKRTKWEVAQAAVRIGDREIDGVSEKLVRA